MIGNFTILNFNQVESTNDLAFELVKQNKAFNHFIISANSQSKGRGRLDRNWESPLGNLYFSLILQPKNSDAVANYSFLTACAIGDVLRLYGIETRYKWPNDIILNQKKLAGILLQFQKINNVNNLVIGVGVNLVSCPEYAVSLVDYGISKEDFLQKFENVFLAYEEQYRQFGFSVIRQKWKNNAYKIGEEVKLSSGEVGVFQDVDKDGNLLLLDGFGKVHGIAVAEIL